MTGVIAFTFPMLLLYIKIVTMFWWVLLALVVLLLVAVLFAPLDFYVNTATQEYYMRLKGILKAALESHAEKVLRLNVSVFFMHFYFYPLQYTPKANDKPKPSKAAKKQHWFAKTNWLQLLRTCTVKECTVDLDTGDYVTNAKLFPVMGLLNMTKGTFTINFEGRNNWLMHIQNRPVRILRVLL